MNEPEYDKYRDVEMWYICPTCNKTFEVDEPDNYCEHYKEKEMHRIVTVCDGETWGDLTHATVIEFPEEQLPMLDWSDRLPREVEEGEEPWNYKEYDLEEYIEKQASHWKDVARRFWQACENGDLDWVDSLCHHYAEDLKEEE